MIRAGLAALLLVAPSAGPVEVFRWQDPAITESSGLVDLGDTVVTTNDSGDEARLFVVDDRGRTVSTVDYDAEVRDVEALAPDDGTHVWVGDVGDNQRSRDDLALHRVRLADGATQSYPVAYADGRARDAETLVALGEGRLAVVTKGLLGEVFVTPDPLREGEVNELTRVAGVGGLLTDGARDPASGLVVLRGYAGAWAYELPSWRRVGDVPLPQQPQGEAVSVGPQGRVRVSSEGAGTPVWQLPQPLAAYATGQPSPVPEPGSADADEQGLTSAGEPDWYLPAWASWAAGAGGLALGLVVVVVARGVRRARRQW